MYTFLKSASVIFALSIAHEAFGYTEKAPFPQSFPQTFLRSDFTFLAMHFAMTLNQTIIIKKKVNTIGLTFLI